MTEVSKKFLNRWAEIFILKLQKEGAAEANAWANRTFTEEVLKELIPIIQSKRLKR
jgi:hypothetical protein